MAVLGDKMQQKIHILVDLILQIVILHTILNLE